jgi:hypothetical protein
VALPHHDIGDLIPVSATFKNAAGAATDPTTITFRLQKPNGTVTAYVYPTDAQLVRDSAGVYHVDVALAAADLPTSLSFTPLWYYRFEGTGAVAATEDGVLLADLSPFFATGLSTRALCSLEDAKLYAKIGLDETDADSEIIKLINAASDAILDLADREFKVDGANPQTRKFDFPEALTPQRRAYTLALGDLTSRTSVTIKNRIDGTTVQTMLTADIDDLPRVRKSWQPITALRLRNLTYSDDYYAEIVGGWGFPLVPEKIRQACKVTVAIWLDRDIRTFSETFSIKEGRIELPRELPRQVYDTVIGYRTRALVA